MLFLALLCLPLTPLDEDVPAISRRRYLSRSANSELPLIEGQHRIEESKNSPIERSRTSSWYNGQSARIRKRGVKADAQSLRGSHFPSQTMNATASWKNPEILRRLQARIVKGTNMKRIYPYIVAFSKSKDLSTPIFCGGTLLSPRHILTAAHCKPENRYVLAEFLHISDISNAQVRQVVSVRYDATRRYREIQGINENDLAIAIVDPPFDFSGTLRSARLPDAKAQAYRTTTVYGWGKRSSEDRTKNSPTLLKADVTVKNCGPQDPIQQFCAGGPLDGRRDSCQNDSGGPLMQRGGNIILGIVSWGRGCGKEAGHYTEVYDYRTYIQQVLLEPPPAILGGLFPMRIEVPGIGDVDTIYVLLGAVGIVLVVVVLLLARSTRPRRPRPSQVRPAPRVNLLPASQPPQVVYTQLPAQRPMRPVYYPGSPRRGQPLMHPGQPLMHPGQPVLTPRVPLTHSLQPVPAQPPVFFRPPPQVVRLPKPTKSRRRAVNKE